MASTQSEFRDQVCHSKRQQQQTADSHNVHWRLNHQKTSQGRATLLRKVWPLSTKTVQPIKSASHLAMGAAACLLDYLERYRSHPTCHYPQIQWACNSRVHTKKYFQNSQTFHKHLQHVYLMQKSNMKVHNSSAHPVKGRNPHYSRSPMHSISRNW